MPADPADAIRLLLPRHGETVYRTIYGIVLDAGRARALTRDTFVHAHRAWEGEEPNARRWLLSSAADLALARRREGEQQGEVAPGSDVVARLLRPLTPEQRAAVTRHCLRAPVTAAPLDAAMRALRRRVRRGDLPDLPTRATDAAILYALSRGLERVPVALPSTDEVLRAARLPLAQRGRMRAPERSPKPRLPYLAAIAAATMLVGVVAGLDLYLTPAPVTPDAARARATAPPHPVPSPTASPDLFPTGQPPATPTPPPSPLIP